MGEGGLGHGHGIGNSVVAHTELVDAVPLLAVGSAQTEEGDVGVSGAQPRKVDPLASDGSV